LLSQQMAHLCTTTPIVEAKGCKAVVVPLRECKSLPTETAHTAWESFRSFHFSADKCRPFHILNIGMSAVKMRIRRTRSAFRQVSTRICG